MPKLMNTNVRSSYLRSFRKILLYGACLDEKLLQEFDGYAKLSCCLEEEHANMIGFKLAGILARGDYDEIAVLTVDGSLHCCSASPYGGGGLQNSEKSSDEKIYGG
jgi:hypothetical protein